MLEAVAAFHRAFVVPVGWDFAGWVQATQDARSSLPARRYLAKHPDSLF